MEIFENDLFSYSGTPPEVAKETADLGLEGMPDAQCVRIFDRAERKFDVMQEIGCDLLMVCSNVSPGSVGGIDRAAA